MPLETGNFITDLVITNPLGTDPKSQGDDHLRLLKKVVQQTLPDFDRAVRLNAQQMNGLTGMIGAFPVAVTVGDGWLIANGQAVLRATFPDLFALLGLVYGPGDGSTDFVLPDYRGRFFRGLDEGAGNDPEAAGRTDRGDGQTGDKVGTLQTQLVGPHLHDVDNNQTGGGSDFRLTGNAGSSVGVTETDIIPDPAGVETRPANISVQYFIHI